MSEAKHTPGPWGVQNGIEIWIMAGGLHVATISRAGDGDWSQADARLIAAAPVLLHEAKCEVEWLEHVIPQITAPPTVMLGFGQALKYLRAAIAKAEGRS